MPYKEKDIKHEKGSYFVLDTGTTYAVMKNGVSYSTSDSEYKRDDDGLSIAIARCNYLAKRKILDLKFIEDSGHGWLEVPYAVYKSSGFVASHYSYKDTARNNVYLEEDLDAPQFKEIMKAKDFEIKIKRDYHDGYCFVRSLENL